MDSLCMLLMACDQWLCLVHLKNADRPMIEVGQVGCSCNYSVRIIPGVSDSQSFMSLIITL